MIHFLEVMILGRQPENWSGVYSTIAQFASHANGRERFVNAKCRPAKQADLLPCHHGNRAISQPVQISAGRVVRAKNLVLSPKHFRDSAAEGILIPKFTDRFVDSI